MRKWTSSSSLNEVRQVEENQVTFIYGKTALSYFHEDPDHICDTHYADPDHHYSDDVEKVVTSTLSPAGILL